MRTKDTLGGFSQPENALDGLPLWARQDRGLVDDDLVLWHTFGVTHQPRLEDFPVMPAEHTGFHPKPRNFFLNLLSWTSPLREGKRTTAVRTTSESSCDNYNHSIRIQIYLHTYHPAPMRFAAAWLPTAVSDEKFSICRILWKQASRAGRVGPVKVYRASELETGGLGHLKRLNHRC